MMNQKTETKKPNAGLTSSIYDFVDKEVDINSNDFIDNKTEDADSDPFLYSLDNMTPDDIATPDKNNKSAFNKIFGVVRNILLVICAAVFVYSAYQIGYSIWGYIESQRITDDFAGLMDFSDSTVFDGEYTYSGSIQLSPELTKSVTSPNYETSILNATTSYDVAADSVTLSVYNPNLEYKKLQMTNVVTEYTDTFAWIKIENTKIDYPVMQSADNDFYLNHSPSGSYLQAGSIFADYRNYPELLKNFNTIFYGHNMQNHTMFSQLTKYLDEDFFYNNPNIEVYTTDGIYVYEVFAFYEARYDDDYIRTGFSTYEEFIEFAESIQERSIYKRDGITFKENDHILTLSTCTNRAQTGRYALHARLVSYEK